MVHQNHLAGNKRSPNFLSLGVILQIVFILVSCSTKKINADDEVPEEDFCPANATVDLNDVDESDSGIVTHDGLSFPKDTVKRFGNGDLRGCICDVKPCIAFCLPENVTSNETESGADYYFDYLAIPRIYTENLTIDDEANGTSINELFHLFYNSMPCDAYNLYPEFYPEDNFYLLRNGSLMLPRENDPTFFDFKNYCLEYVGNNHSVYLPRVCSPPEAERDDLEKLKYIGGLIAIPFLIATVIVYSILPEFKNIHGHTLRCYLCCMIVTYIGFAVDRIPPPDPNAGLYCLCLGFTIYFSFLASFFWLNVMSLDMWWRFGGFGSLRSSGVRHDRKKFIGYSIYVWGATSLMTAICIAMEFSQNLPDSMIRPGFKSGACWFDSTEAEALYFYGPVALLILCNIAMFVATSIKMCEQRRDSQRQLNTRESRRHDDDKQLFNLFLKLFVVMGINWSTEIISWLWEGPKYFWIFTDTLNAIQGIFIFVVMVCKPNIIRSIKKRLRKKQNKVPKFNLDNRICRPRFSSSNSTAPSSRFSALTGTSSYDSGSQITRMSTFM